jgi:DNA polymerase-3 subunit gamma/tau
MSYQVLARKWRPRNFTELVGQDHVQRALVNALDNDRLHHAYLFTGTRGVGKTTIARIFAKSLNCEEGVSSTPCGKCSACEEINEGRFIDLIEVDAASRTKVEDTRELLENVQYAPTRGRYKVYLIDEVHMLSGHSFNALLKTLEEPPPHVKFLLATTDPQRLPVTVLSRCLQFNLKSLTLSQISGQIDNILKQEQVDSDAGAVRELAFSANGSMRDALSLLDQAIAFGNGSVAEDEVRAMLGTIDRDVIYRLLDALSQADAALLLDEVNKTDAFAPDYTALLADLVSVLQRIAIAQTLPDAYQIGLIGRRDLPLSPEPRGGFEMVLLRMLAFRPVQAEARAPALPQKSQAAQPAAVKKAALKPAPQVASGGGTADASTSEWAGIIESLSLKGMAREMSLNCVFHGMQDDVVELTLDPAHVHLLGKAREEQLEAALAEYYQRKVSVRINKKDKLQSETPAGQRTRQKNERQQQAEQSIQQDENIKAIQDAFGGSVNQESIRPRD